MATADNVDGLSRVKGLRLEEEPGIGALTIPGYLNELVSRFAKREAVIMNTPGQRITWTYEDLQTRATEVGRALIASGVGKHGRVGILMTNRPEFLAALFGTAMVGGVAVALSTFSTSQELDYLIKTAEISVLLFEERVLKKNFLEMLGELDPSITASTSGGFSSTRFPFLSRLVMVPDAEGEAPSTRTSVAGVVESWGAFLTRGETIDADVVRARAARVLPSDPGGIFFSSGTTSLPKGIAHSQKSFAVQWWRWPRVLLMGDRVRSWTGNGFFWSGNVSMVVGSALTTGGAVILQRYFDEADALRLIEAEKISFANGRPHQWARLRASPDWAKANLSSIKYAPRGELLFEHPTINTNYRVPMSFGTTETMTICTSVTGEPAEHQINGNCGRPLPGNTLKIVDPLTGVILPLGERGEMCIKGPTLMSGYLGKPREACFDEEGFYWTGDGGRVDAAGSFFWEGRLTDMIKTGGANVSPEEIDEVIGNFPGVKRSQTVGVPDDLMGELVVACIVPVTGTLIDNDRLEAHLKKNLASFKIPRKFLYFSDAEFFLTGNEKVKASEIRTLAAGRLGLLPAASVE